MKTKLTLTIEQSVVEEAKRYSRKNRKSLSALIEEFLHQLSYKNQAQVSVVEKTKGILKDKYQGKADKEIREEIYREKYGI